MGFAVCVLGLPEPPVIAKCMLVMPSFGSDVHLGGKGEGFRV